MKQLISLLLLMIFAIACTGRLDNEQVTSEYLESSYEKMLEREGVGVTEIKEQVARIGNRPEDQEVAAVAEKILRKAKELFESIDKSTDLEEIKKEINSFQKLCNSVKCEYGFFNRDIEMISSPTQAKYMVLRLTQDAIRCQKLQVATTS